MDGPGRHAGCCCLLKPLPYPCWSAQAFAPCMLSPSSFCHARTGAGRHAGCCCLLRPLPYRYWSAQPFAPCMLSPSSFSQGWGRQACWVLLPSEAAPIPILVSSTFCPLACSAPLPFAMDGAGRHAGCCCLLRSLPYPYWSAQSFAPCMLSPSSFCHARTGAGRHAGCCCLLRPLRDPYWSVQPFAPCMLSPSAFCHAMNVAGRHAGCCCLLRPLAYPYWSPKTFCPLHAQSLCLLPWMGQAGMLGAAAF